MKLQLFYPIKPFAITQGFGTNLYFDYTKICSGGQCLIGHNGLDCIRGYVNGKYYETEGCYVRAAHDGIVAYAGVDGAEGYGIVLRTKEPYDYNGVPTYFKTIYWHMKPPFAVTVGDEVFVGDYLGEADNTGMSTGSHLHFGLKPIALGENDWEIGNLEQKNGYFGAIDPLPYFNGKYAFDNYNNLVRMVEALRAKIKALLQKMV